MSFLASIALGFTMFVSSIFAWPLSILGITSDQPETYDDMPEISVDIPVIEANHSLSLVERQELYNLIYPMTSPSGSSRPAVAVVNGKEISGADQGTLIHSHLDFYQDKNFVYFHVRPLRCGDGYIFDPHTVSFFDDIQTSETSRGQWPLIYGLKDSERIFINENIKFGDKCMPASVDADTFVYLGKFYSRDKDVVYYDDQIIAHADVATFKVIQGEEQYDAQDKNYKYLNGEIVYTDLSEGAHAERIVFTDAFGNTTGYEKDKNNVYYNGALVPNADPQTFEIIEYTQKKGYECDDERLLYAKDKSSVYFGQSLVQGAEPNTAIALVYCEPIGTSWYLNDGAHVFHWFDLIDGADSSTFTLVETKQRCEIDDPKKGFSEYVAFDKHRTYFQNQISACSTPVGN